MADSGAVYMFGLDEGALCVFATRLAKTLGNNGVIHLTGDLGAGKTTFARSLIMTLGIRERIKSPTYSLIESYRGADLSVHHLDLYRIVDPGELEWLGLADMLTPNTLMLVEWPDRGGPQIPSADLVIRLAHAGAKRDLTLLALTDQGRSWVAGALTIE
jgi:tRNA threonylcarbamoyladenosine biosynthesis protein TsaE